MPHTNRARRADHYRSIDGKGTTASGSTDTSTKTGSKRRHSNHEQEDASAINSAHGGGSSSSERYGGRGAGRGRGGRGSIGGRHAANGRGMGRGGGSGRPAETDGADPPPAGAGSKGKSKNPSVKNRIRGLTRLMNKPVRVVPGWETRGSALLFCLRVYKNMCFLPVVLAAADHRHSGVVLYVCGGTSALSQHMAWCGACGEKHQRLALSLAQPHVCLCSQGLAYLYTIHSVGLRLSTR